mmetsp:Transcript_29225/g.26627  ORF Transcript_29225/g.26627 Transcript_29225/m.26627 type:complete len:106 (+) Transcript_29225:1192-1509(+)
MDILLQGIDEEDYIVMTYPLISDSQNTTQVAVYANGGVVTPIPVVTGAGEIRLGIDYTGCGDYYFDIENQVVQVLVKGGSCEISIFLTRVLIMTSVMNFDFTQFN